MSKIKINPALVAALEHYAKNRYDFTQPTEFFHRDAMGHESLWPLERTCEMAAEVLSYEGLAYLKLKVIQDGMKEQGMERLYEHIMGEKLGANPIPTSTPPMEPK